MLSRPFLIALIITLQSLSAFAQAPSAKLPIPDAASKKKASANIKELFGDQFKKALLASKKIALAKELLQEGVASKDNPASRYVLLRIAKDIAAGAGDADTAFNAIDQMHKYYSLDVVKLKYDTLIIAAGKAKTKTASKVIVEKASLLIEDSVKADNYKQTQELGKIALTAVRKLRDSKILKQIKSRNEDIGVIAKEYEKVKTALKTLESKPVDGAANQSVGMFYCLFKGNWDKGLHMLALGDDASLKSLALKELEGATTQSELLSLGNGWWNQAAKEEGMVQKQMQAHAAIWYREAMPKLTGIDKRTIAKRLEQAPEVLSVVSIPARVTGTAPSKIPPTTPSKGSRPIPTKGLVARYNFDSGSGNVAKDSVGKNHGKIVGASWAKGVRSGALSFDGVKSHVRIPTIKTANSSFTFSFLGKAT